MLRTTMDSRAPSAEQVRPHARPSALACLRLYYCSMLCVEASIHRSAAQVYAALTRALAVQMARKMPLTKAGGCPGGGILCRQESGSESQVRWTSKFSAHNTLVDVVVRESANDRAPRRLRRLDGTHTIPYPRSFRGVAALACVASSQKCQSRLKSMCKLVSPQ